MVVAVRREHDVFSAHAGRPDVFSDDALSSSMSTKEKLVSVSDDEKRNEKSVCDLVIVKARLEPVDTRSKAFASTLRGSPIKGHLCVAGMSTQSPGPFWRSAADRRECLVTYIMICISENPVPPSPVESQESFDTSTHAR